MSGPGVDLPKKQRNIQHGGETRVRVRGWHQGQVPTFQNARERVCVCVWGGLGGEREKESEREREREREREAERDGEREREREMGVDPRDKSSVHAGLSRDPRIFLAVRNGGGVRFSEP